MVSVSIGTSVASSLDTARKEQIERNLHYLKTVIWAIMFCATQEIALRGHREGMSSNNKGSFLELIDLLTMYDLVVRDQLAHIWPSQCTVHLTHYPKPTASYFRRNV